MTWPTPQDYNEAVQNPDINFGDADLRSGKVQTNKMGLPTVVSGAFASVYRFRCGQRDVAVRCFLRDTPDQQTRYEKISRYVMSDDLPYTVSFEYQSEGIRIHGQWFPILKMEWVDGLPLDIYIRKHIRNSAKMHILADGMKTMTKELRRGGIAHGDLQHGNIIVTSDEALRLVDYDGMFVPELAGFEANELGHRNYQHPGRSRHDFSPRLDNFSAWSIYTSLQALAMQPDLLDDLRGGDESLLFKQNDYRYPLRSIVFHTLETKCDEQIAVLSRKLRFLLQKNVDEVPYLDEDIPNPTGLPAINPDYIGVSFSSANLPGGISKSPGIESAFESAATPEPTNWPTLHEYTLAASNPHKAFNDAELQSAIMGLDHGQIRPSSGENGIVFRYHVGDDKQIAVKLFRKHDPLREQRYASLSEYLEKSSVDTVKLRQHLVQFEYIAEGILVGSTRYPVLKMHWLDGATLWDTIERDRHNKIYMRSWIEKFNDLVMLLRRIGLSHGDLTPDNIIVSGGDLYLVDYDTMRSPRALIRPGVQQTSKHYRHPLSGKLQDPFPDSFSAWLIDASMAILMVQPSLWNQFNVKPGRLLFTDHDLADPEHSETLTSLNTTTTRRSGRKHTTCACCAKLYPAIFRISAQR